MTDLERLELAAQAAGIRYRKPHPEYTGSFGLFLEDEAGNIVGNWNPLTDAGENGRAGLEAESVIRKEAA
jgi:hypothetical protein